jgi:hypothetical protein
MDINYLIKINPIIILQEKLYLMLDFLVEVVQEVEQEVVQYV